MLLSPVCEAWLVACLSPRKGRVCALKAALSATTSIVAAARRTTIEAAILVASLRPVRLGADAPAEKPAFCLRWRDWRLITVVSPDISGLAVVHAGTLSE